MSISIPHRHHFAAGEQVEKAVPVEVAQFAPAKREADSADTVNRQAGAGNFNNGYSLQGSVDGNSQFAHGVLLLYIVCNPAAGQEV